MLCLDDLFLRLDLLFVKLVFYSQSFDLLLESKPFAYPFFNHKVFLKGRPLDNRPNDLLIPVFESRDALKCKAPTPAGAPAMNYNKVVKDKPRDDCHRPYPRYQGWNHFRFQPDNYEYTNMTQEGRDYG